MLFDNSTVFAEKQDKLINKIRNNQSITKAEISDLRNNLWFAGADMTAPSNLSVRMYCLEDLYEGKPNRVNKLANILKILSYDSKIWAEGYSYWLYTRDAVDLWQKRFSNQIITDLIYSIDSGFVKTAYLRETVWYPAPFGDLRDISLNPDLQGRCVKTTFYAGIVSMFIEGDKIMYQIQAKPIGLNLHVPAKDSKVTIENGIPVGFKFYTGWNDKYPSKGAQIKDALNPKRLFSIFR